jgi:hypothetical protein
MPRLALYTFGLLKDFIVSEILADFVAIAPSVFADAKSVDRFIALRVLLVLTWPRKRKFGEECGPMGHRLSRPAFIRVQRSREKDTTLSLWWDIEALGDLPMADCVACVEATRRMVPKT